MCHHAGHEHFWLSDIAADSKKKKKSALKHFTRNAQTKQDKLKNEKSAK